MHILLLILSILDGLFTIYWVQTKQAQEANILLAPLLTYSPVLFFVVKITLTILGIYILWEHRKRITARLGLYTCTGAYIVLNCYHIQYSVGI